MVLIAISAILMTVAVQKWSFILQREKEKELIYRGTSIARAIQEYQTTANRAPTTFEEMTRTKPPVLRRVYDDPMTARYDRDGKLEPGTGRWTRITAAPPGTRQPDRRRRLGDPPPEAGGDPAGADGKNPTTPGSLADRNKPEITPFIGVRSKSEEISIGTYQDSEPEAPYSEWKFMPPNTVSTSIPTFKGRIDTPYPPGFGGLRLPGGPPVGSGVPVANPGQAVPRGPGSQQPPRAPTQRR
jgi:type II secretory pathway pseudopilin PulG